MKFIIYPPSGFVSPESVQWELVFQNDVFMGFTISGLQDCHRHHTKCEARSRTMCRSPRVVPGVPQQELPGSVPPFPPMRSVCTTFHFFFCVQGPVVSTCWPGSSQLSPEFRICGAR